MNQNQLNILEKKKKKALGMKLMTEEIESLRPLIEDAAIAKKTLKDFKDIFDMLNVFKEHALLYDEEDDKFTSQMEEVLGKEKFIQTKSETNVEKIPTISADSGSEATKYLAHEKMRAMWPWFTMAETSAATRTRFESDFKADKAEVIAQLQTRFRTHVKQGRLTAEQALTLLYILYSSAEYAPFMLADWMLSSNPREAITNHNWSMADNHKKPQWFKEVYGPQLMHMDVPIFPEMAELDGLNLQLLDGMLTGGDGEEKGSKVYKKSGNTPKKIKVLHGAGPAFWVPVLTNENGPYVDLSDIAQWSKTADDRKDAVENALRNNTHKKSGPPRQYQNRGQNLAQIICFKCTQPGHKANVCTNPPVRNNQHHQYGQQQQRYIQGGDPPPGFRDVPASGTLMQ